MLFIKHQQSLKPPFGMESYRQPKTTKQDLETHSTQLPLSPNHRKSMKPMYHKKRRHTNKKDKEKKKFNSSLWTLAENTAYTTFLAQNTSLFQMTKIQRRDSKINVLMSQAIKTRSADQCRSHHQKMMKYHRDIASIIVHVDGLKQNQSENPSEPLEAEVAEMPEPVLLDFFNQEEVLGRFLFYEQAMDEEWNSIWP